MRNAGFQLWGNDATRSPYVYGDDIWNPHAGLLHVAVCVIGLLGAGKT